MAHKERQSALALLKLSPMVPKPNSVGDKRKPAAPGTRPT